MSRNLPRIVLLTLCAALGTTFASERSPGSLAKQRTIAFDADRGSFRNVDVAPQGDRIAFDFLGDIYIAPIQGGDARAVTSGTSWNVRPVWSPDGKRIAFISDREGDDQAYIAEIGESASIRQATHDTSRRPTSNEGLMGYVEWLPEGTEIVADGRLYSLDQSAPYVSRTIGDLSHVDVYGNGSGLYQMRILAEPEASNGGKHSVAKRLPGNGEWNEVARLHSPPGALWAQLVAVSRDERWMVFRAGHKATRGAGDVMAGKDDFVEKIVVYDCENGTYRTIVAPMELSDGRMEAGVGVLKADRRYAFTPDSKYLLLAYDGRVRRVDLNGGTIQTIDIRVHVDKEVREVVRNKVGVDESPVSILNMRGTTMSPDGKQIAFSALRRIYISGLVEPASVAVENLASGQFQPSYSPDGQWIAFVSWNENQGGHLWRVPSGGGKAEKLTQTPGHYQSPAWSPDGRRIAFIGSSNWKQPRAAFYSSVMEGELRLLSLENLSVTTLARKVRFGNPPVFSGDGRTVRYAEFHSEHSLELDIRSVAIDGSKDRNLGLGTVLPYGGEVSAIPSPDGRLIALIKHGDLYVLECETSIDSRSFNIRSCEETRITYAGASSARWSADGTRLEWDFANTHYRLDTDSILAYTRAIAHSGRMADPIATELSLIVPRNYARGSLVLKDARVITMKDDVVFENGVVVIRDGRIESVGAASRIEIPHDADAIDLKGATIAPGFIDAHAHLTKIPRDLLDSSHGELLANLAFGVTTVKDPSNGGIHSFSYGELIETGDVVGPRLLGADGWISLLQMISSPEDAVFMARRVRRLGGTFVKIHSGWNREQRGWIVEAARGVGLNVAAHFPASNYVPGRLNLSTVVDGATSGEHRFSKLMAYEDVVRFLSASGTVVNFSSIAGDSSFHCALWDEVADDVRIRAFHVGGSPRCSRGKSADASSGIPRLSVEGANSSALANDISSAGGLVSIGSHGDFDGIGLHWEMWAHSKGGMSNYDVMRAATINGALALGVESDLGSIEVGKVADLIVMRENPLADIRNTLTVEMVMKHGVLRDSATLEELWPRKQEHSHLHESGEVGIDDANGS